MSQRYIGGLIYNPPGGYSGYFDGSGDYLTFNPSTAINIGTSDFTVEAWVYHTGGVDDTIVSNSGSFTFVYGATGALRFYLGSGASIVTASTAFISNQWVHVAAVRSSGTLKLYQNGVEVASSSSYPSISNSSSTFYIGRFHSGTTQDWLGNISNLRIVVGTAVYTSSFTPPNGPLQAISGTSLLTCAYSTFRDGSSNNFTITVNGNTSVSTQNPFPITTLPNPALGNQGNGVYSMSQYVALKAQGLWPAYDPYFNYTTLLLHGDGTNGAQNNTFLDSSTNNFTITRNGNTTQGTFSPFSQDDGKWGAYFDGDNDNLSVADNAAIDFGTGTVTIEAWIYMTSNASAYRMIVQKYSSPSGYELYVSNADKLECFLSGTTITSTGTLSLNTWYHVAVVRAGTGANQTKLYINGVEDGSGTSSGNLDNTNALYIGTTSGNTNDFAGYISNVRITNTAVYTSAFTPSTTPLTAISGTSLLTCQSNRFKDNSANAFAITVNGNTSIQPFSPFAPSAAYSAATNGGSGYFDGSGDYLTAGSASDWTFLSNGAQDYTIEAFVYLSSLPAIQAHIISNNSASASSGYRLYITSSGDIVSSYTRGVTGSTLSVTASSVITPNTWYYIAVTFTDSTNTCEIFVNGASSSSGVISAFSANTPPNALNIGREPSSGSGLLTGYISNLRISSSIRTVTSIPTTPYTSDANTSLLCNFTNAGILDNTGRNVLETVGNAQISTSVKKFGTGSLAFDGTGDWVVTPYKPQLDLAVGNWTVECWVYPTSTATKTVFIINGASSSYGQVQVATSSGGAWYLLIGVGATSWLSTSTGGSYSPNNWYHIAAVRSGSSIVLYVNGTSVLSQTSSSNLYAFNSSTYVGADSSLSQNFAGYIDDLRITKGIARYTSNFTPQTSQWQDQ